MIVIARAAFCATLAIHAASAGAALAQDRPKFLDDFSGSLALTSDYRFRGVSQTMRDPAVQGSLEWSRDFGLFAKPYLSIFASNVKFPNTTAGGKVRGQELEVDLAGGLRFDLVGVGVDVGIVRYLYPGFEKATDQPFSPDWTEGYVKLSYDAGFATLQAAYFYAPSFTLNGGRGHYANVGADIPLEFAWDTVLGLRIGRQWIQRESNVGLPDYTDWSIGVSKDLFGLTWSLAYVDTTVKKGEHLAGGGAVDARVARTADPGVVATVTWKF